MIERKLFARGGRTEAKVGVLLIFVELFILNAPADILYRIILLFSMQMLLVVKHEL
jgi:hypothetical protein